MIIFLIGFMGCGKTTLGKRLSRKLDYSFYDMDEEIEKKAGLSVSEIFSQKGEAAFRKMEREYLKSLNPESDLVIATGGGAPCFGDNIELMNQLGITVYLKMSPVSLAGRLQKARSIRPLIEGLGDEALLEFIHERLKEREPHYKKAKCIMKGENVKSSHVVALVFGDSDE